MFLDKEYAINLMVFNYFIFTLTIMKNLYFIQTFKNRNNNITEAKQIKYKAI